MRIEKLLTVLLLLGLPTLSFAIPRDSTLFAPEPETLALIGGAAVAWAIVRWKKRK